jgi:hypothetical protein
MISVRAAASVEWAQRIITPTDRNRSVRVELY